MRQGTFFCIDAHTCGNPVRLVAGGVPPLEGNTMSEKRQYFLEHYDWIRQALMFEPRGHSMMSGSVVLPPCSDNADASILFIETSGCLPMCGHGTIGTVTTAIENRLITPKKEGRLILDVPAGQIEVHYQTKGDKVTSVKIFNVPAYLAHQDVTVEIEGLGEITVDVAYGGNYYVIVDPQENYAGLEHYSPDEILMLSPKCAPPFLMQWNASIQMIPRFAAFPMYFGQGNQRKTAQRLAMPFFMAIKHSTDRHVEPARAHAWRNGTRKENSNQAKISCMKASSAAYLTAVLRVSPK